MDTFEVASHADRPIPAKEVIRLYRQERWWPQRTATDLEGVLDSAPAVAAWKGHSLVGFARAITDGCFRAYIEDVIVHPALRHQGIGASMIRHLEGLLDDTGDPVTLFCGADLVPFYEQLGYRRTDQVVLHRSLPNQTVRASGGGAPAPG